MKKILTYSIIILIVNIINLISNEISFTPERMMTDFNGVVYNGNNIICYGNYGIITFSKDKGKKWYQINIGDKYNIKKLVTLDRELYGITDYSLLKSTDDGISWMNKEIRTNPDIISLKLVDNSIFILTKNSLLKSDLNLNIDTKPIIELDPNQLYKEIEEHNGSIYLLSDVATNIGKKHILKYNISSKLTDTLLLDTVYISHQFKNNVSNLKFKGNDIYYLDEKISLDYPNDNKYETIMKSTDNGKTWIRYSFGDCLFRIINDDLMCLSYLKNQIVLSIIQDTIYQNYYSIKKLITDTTSVPVIEQRLNFSYLNDYIKINDDTLIAVGNNKLIAISYNGGVKWNIISFYYDILLYTDIKYFSVERPPIVLNDNSIIYTNRYRTTNGGITWIPILTTEAEKLKEFSADFYYFDRNGKGFFAKHEVARLNLLISNNYGETYSQTNYEIPSMAKAGANLTNPGLEIKDRILFAKATSSGYYSTVYIFNKYNQLINSVKIDSVLIINIVKDQNSNLYTIGISMPNGIKDNKSFKYHLLLSKDLGDSWEIILKDMPLEKRIFNNFYFEPFKYIFAYKNFIIIPDIWTEPTKLYIFDTNESKFDSIYIPFKISKIYNAIFSYKGDFFAISENNTFYRTNNFGSKNIQWDSVHISKFLTNWQNYQPGSNSPGRDIIYSVWTDDNQIILLTLKTKNIYLVDQPFIYFQSNIVRLFKREPSLVDEIETERVYLWSGEPFPTPSIDYVKIPVYWNNIYDIKNAIINFYDFLGNKLISPSFSIEPINNFSANIVLNCKELKSGIYFISINLGNEVRYSKINVVK